MKQQNTGDKEKIVKVTKNKRLLQGKDKRMACRQQQEMPEVNK